MNLPRIQPRKHREGNHLLAALALAKTRICEKAKMGSLGSRFPQRLDYCVLHSKNQRNGVTNPKAAAANS